jgi:hypothetical protein
MEVLAKRLGEDYPENWGYVFETLTVHPQQAA